jgi:hypothetical protein
MPLCLFENQPLRAPFHKRLRHSGLDPRNPFINHLLGVRACHTGVLRGAMRHRERIRTRLDHPFDPTPIGFAFSTRRRQERLNLAERRKIGLTRLNDNCPKRLDAGPLPTNVHSMRTRCVESLVAQRLIHVAQRPVKLCEAIRPDFHDRHGNHPPTRASLASIRLIHDLTTY